MGFIAEDVYKILPELVKKPKDKSIEESVPALVYDEFIPYIVKLCQVQQEKIDALEEEINKLKEKMV